MRGCFSNFMASCMTTSIAVFPLLSERTEMLTSALTSNLPGTTVTAGSTGNFSSTSIHPPMSALSTTQSWMLDVPSMRILLPVGWAA
ncbi:MAG: hypothetical protein JW388_1325 [Nitrospira sp.]|nr:hypothetical protein [Nitrospira sp.]